MTEATLPSQVRTERTGNPVLQLTVMTGCFALIFLVCTVFGVRGWDLLVLGMALFTGIVSLLPFVADSARPPERRQILIALLSLSLVMRMVLPVFTQYLFIPEDVFIPGRTRLANVAAPDIVMGQLAFLVGLVSMLAAFYLPIGPFLARFIPRPRYEWSHSAALTIALFMLGVGWFVFLGGQTGLIPRRAGTGFLGTIATSTYFALSLLTLIYLRYRSRVALLLLVAFLVPTVFFNFFTGSKRLMLTPPAMVVLAYMLWYRQIRISWIAAGIAILIFLYPLAQFYRESIQGAGFHQRSAVQVLSDPAQTLRQLSDFFSGRETGEYLTEGLSSAAARLSALGVLCVIVRDTPEPVPFQRGKSLLNIPMSYVPRLLWPGKPIIGIGQWVTDNYGSGPGIRSNTGPTWFGELYFNFGWTGIVTGMLILGIFFRILHEFCYTRQAPLPAMLTGVMVLNMVARTPEGSVQKPINGVIFSILPIMAGHFLVRAFGGVVRPRDAAREADPGEVRAPV